MDIFFVIVLVPNKCLTFEMGVSEDSVSHWGTVRESALGLISAVWEELANFKRVKC